ncbi:hypothetical protein [Sphingomonas endolithica]|uniref:hypothetical protein n=1 Tax=Sphingomonas endolithica TaxID=2972485 RepID=UPI0021B07CEE|nr:hypothetical protein [Sphingomonas sp. ZFBP2030]
MASNAPITGARTRAPHIPADDVPPQNPSAPGPFLTDLHEIQMAAEAIKAVIFVVELMLQDQRRVMQEENAYSFLHENELWDGTRTLLAMASERATTIGELGELMEMAEMRVSDAPAAV